ncbi:MAG: hypothetical protein O7H41_00415 [Planctomycetota bacterium]|nr:hypothetical protein [Planctomycetota bacterium]
MSGVLARTPNRIDLAGGTLDIQPLAQIFPGSLTVNLAVSIESEAEVELADGPTKITSEDLGRTTELESLSGGEVDPEFRLIVEAARALSPPGELSIRTHNHAPRGSGLGASSALTICLLGAIAHLLKRPRTLDEMIQIAVSVEMGVLGVPSGTQDHYAAALGGALAVHHHRGSVRAERLPASGDFKDALEETILLHYTGVPHDSGAMNWEVVRSALDGKTRTLSGLTKIRDIAIETREAFLEGNIRRIGRLVAAESKERRKLARGVVPAEIDRVMKEARRAGALGSKLSGAGGGGTLVTVVPPDKKPAVMGVLESAGFTLLPWSVSPTGLRVTKP